MASIYRQLLDAPPGTPFDLTVDQVELAEEVVAYTADRTHVRLRRLAIDVYPDHVEATVELKLGFFWSTVCASGRVWVHERTVDFVVDALRMGQAQVPTLFREQILYFARRALHPARMPVELDRLDLDCGRLRVAGRTKSYVLS